MSDEAEIAGQMEAHSVASADGQAGAVVRLRAGGQSLAALMSAEQVADLTHQLLAWLAVNSVAQDGEGRRGRPLPTTALMVEPGRRPETAILSFQTGAATIGFEVPEIALLDLGNRLSPEPPRAAPVTH